MYPEENFSPTPHPQKPVYSRTDTAYAWLSLIAAYLFCDALPIAQYPLYGFLLIFGLFAAGFLILGLKKQKFCPACILSTLSALVISGGMLLSETEFLVNLSFAYCLAGFCYFLYAAFGNRIEAGFSDLIYIDFIKILLVLPFRGIGTIFPALATRSTQKGSRILLKALLGIGIAFIPTAMVFSYLSYDAGFTKLLENLFSFDMEKIGHIVRCLIFTLPLAMYGFGLYASSMQKVLLDKMDAASCQNGLRKAQILPQLTALFAVFPILFLYAVFFISQWQYYLSGFTGILPENFSYAEYARQGFFELCSVSVINLILIVGIAFFIKRGKRDSAVVLKIVAVVFCLCTLILISTAVAKLGMYIHSYGLTEKRIYAMWLMVLIGIVFLLIALAQFWRKFKVVAVSLSVAIMMFAGLAVCNVNGLCAQYNAQRYLSGSLETLDVRAMEDLGDSAIPALLQVSNTMDAEKDPQLKHQIDIILFNKYVALRNEDTSILSFNIPAAQATTALRDYFPNIPPSGRYHITDIKRNGIFCYNAYNDGDGMVITADRTGSITCKEETAVFRIEANKVLFENTEWELSCHYDDAYQLSKLRLYYYDGANTYTITLKPVG